MGNSLDPDKGLHFVWPDLGSNCLHRLIANNTSRQRVSLKVQWNFHSCTRDKHI